MRRNKIFSKVPTTAIFFVAIIFSTLTFTASTFEQSEGMNHTTQNMKESANQTIQNKTGEAILLQKNVTDLGSNLTEIAKKLAKSINEGMKNLSQ